MKIPEDIRQRERVLRPEREHQRVFGGRRLQLEVELPAESLAEREPPRLVDAAPKGGVQHELHAARRVEKPLEHEPLLRRDDPERAAAFRQVLDGLLGGILLETALRHQPGDHVRESDRALQLPIHFASKAAERAGQLVAARRRLAQPERDRRGGAVRIRHPDIAARNLQHAPRCVAELEHVPGIALDGEVFVERADERVLGVEDDAVVGDLGDGAAGCLGEQPGASTSANRSVHLVAVDQRRATSSARGKAVRRHPQHAVERRAVEVSIGPGAGDERKQLVFRIIPARRFGDDLLREHVERRVVRHDGVKETAADRSQERRAFHEVIP